ncbi:glycosyltransferase family 2 protein [Acidithiobacillus sp. IBUN Pt1247-S3]|uniref:glycosyltransferase family 2 protein n=1 Tax=Acidithiobacillus sp. IBUN Pt1247-S3 TaxID=3166642 RepID=UPI0034E5B1AD
MPNSNEETSLNEMFDGICQRACTYLISVIIPCHNESENIEPLYHRVQTVLEGMQQAWEIIFINDGSSDDTLLRLLALREKDKRVTVINLSRNFGKEAALTSGLDHANGDVAVPLDADLQDPPELIPELFAKFLEGYDVINAIRNKRLGESYTKRLSSYLYYRLLDKISNVPIPHDTGDYRMLSRRVLEALKRMPERRRYMKGLFAWTGYRTTSIHYQREPRHAGQTGWTYWKLWHFAVEGITSFSHVPLQLASYLGLTIALTSFIAAAYLVIDTLIYGNSVKGYPSLMVTVLFLGGVQLMALGIIGEYISRIYEESKNRPIYLVQDIWSSKIVTLQDE